MLFPTWGDKPLKPPTTRSEGGRFRSQHHTTSPDPGCSELWDCSPEGSLPVGRPPAQSLSTPAGVLLSERARRAPATRGSSEWAPKLLGKFGHGHPASQVLPKGQVPRPRDRF